MDFEICKVTHLFRQLYYLIWNVFSFAEGAINYHQSFKCRQGRGGDDQSNVHFCATETAFKLHRTSKSDKFIKKLAFPTNNGLTD